LLVGTSLKLPPMWSVHVFSDGGAAVEGVTVSSNVVSQCCCGRVPVASRA
jgi:hypothetical protein